MLVALFVRHFKIYRNINYIPISGGQRFSSYIGANGSGKSSVLEALDRFFNLRDTKEWNINRRAKNEGSISGDKFPFIAPIFLLRKDKIKADDPIRPDMETISKFLWEIDPKSYGEEARKFADHRSILRDKFSSDDHFLILVGKKYNDNKSIYFGSFHNALRSKMFPKIHGEAEQEQKLQATLKPIMERILDLYSYFHIPVETDPAAYTKLETVDMQKLMDEDIQQEISKAITDPTVRQINKELDSFVAGIQDNLIDYKYKGTFKDRLTMTDLVSKILEAYFSIKILHRTINKMDIPVGDLSSGEKRKSLVDLAYSFLKRKGKRSQEIIVAIDEPDASLHISACFDQFERLHEIAALGNQIVITTHWYGFLPVISEGVANSIEIDTDGAATVKTFDLYNYHEQITHAQQRSREQLPKDIHLKSQNDLVQSIVASMIRPDPYNWLICEGLSEKIYFDHYLHDLVSSKRLRILPLGGFKAVKRAYEYLVRPLQDPVYDIQSKAICLIDTDAQRIDVNVATGVPCLEFLRLLNTEKGTTLVKVDAHESSPPTEIEDCLTPALFIQALESFEKDYPKLTPILKEMRIPSSPRNIVDLDLKDSQKRALKEFFDLDDNKVRFARVYISLDPETKAPPEWIQELRKKYKEKK